MEYNKIKHYRQKLGIKQTELAHAIGLSNSMISKYENGEITPSQDKIEAIAKYFNIDPTELMVESIPKSLSLLLRTDSKYLLLHMYIDDIVLFVSKYTCDLCGMESPFKIDSKSNSFFETYHINCSQSKACPPDQIAVLCPNCYKYMTMSDDDNEEKKNILQQKASIRAKSHAEEISNLEKFYLQSLNKIITTGDKL